MVKYGRRFLKLFYRLGTKTEFSEITVDQLFKNIKSNEPPLIVDIRSTKEFNGRDGHILDARHIPIRKLKSQLGDLQDYKEKEIVTICPGGGLSLIAVDLLIEAGFKNVKSLHGGLDLWRKKGYPLIISAKTDFAPQEEFKANPLVESGKNIGKLTGVKYSGEVHKTVDARNLSCPQPVLRSKKILKELKIGQVLEILATDPGSKNDIPAWASATGQELLAFEEPVPKEFRYLVKKIK